MWPPEFWKELAWWPTGARSDVVTGDLAELTWWPPVAGDLAERLHQLGDSLQSEIFALYWN